MDGVLMKERETFVWCTFIFLRETQQADNAKLNVVSLMRERDRVFMYGSSCRKTCANAMRKANTRSCLFIAQGRQ